MYGEWVTLPELNGNVIVRAFVYCMPKDTPEAKGAIARSLLRDYLEHLEKLEKLESEAGAGEP